MYINRNYGFWMTFSWSKKPFIYGTFYGLVICSLANLLEVSLALPWGPIGVIGVAVAFYLGFKNNSSYDRTWEARKVWGSLVNNSRTFGAAVVAFVQGPEEKAIQKELIYRHIAWLTALRHQLRLSRPWEHTDERLNNLYNPQICEDYNNRLEAELAQYLSRDEIKSIEGSTNKATQIMRRQSARMQELKDQGLFEDFRHMEFHQLITTFYADQGKSERIKDFPFPRQYASTALWLAFIFCAFVPFGLLDMIETNSLWRLALCPFLTGLITWVFFLMEMIGDYSENPFEGTYNDVPITAISRSIEIDLREMINDQNIPAPIQENNGFLM